MQKIKVLIVEDSRVIQNMLYEILTSDADINVVGVASDPFAARELIKKTNPNVITLDIMLPGMDGITFLRNIMRLHPIPTVMISSLTESTNALALEALSIGAIDCLNKPSKKDFGDLTNYTRKVINAVKNAAKAHVVKYVSPTFTEKKLDKIIRETEFLKNRIIAIGASTGGIEAIEKILTGLPHILPPVVIVQHIQKEFSKAFAKRLVRTYGLEVTEIENYMILQPGKIYIATCDEHVTVTKQKETFMFKLKNSEPVDGHKPSIDVLFHSLPQTSGTNTIGILLTGMGSDGAEGLKAIHSMGGDTIVQDEETSVVWGMPGSAVKMHAVDYVLPIDKIAAKILNIIDSKTIKIKSPT